MSNSKFSLADVLSLLTAFAFGFVCFLGLNFKSSGENVVKSIIIALIVSLLLWCCAFGLKLLKGTRSNFKTCIIWEMILFIFLTLITGIFSVSVFSHYFTVSQQASNIQSELTKSITQAEGMFSSYENYANKRESNYERKLKSVVNTKNTNPSQYAEYGFENNGIADLKQIENKMFTIHAELFPTNYSNTIDKNGLREIATLWLGNAKNNISTWNPIGIVSVVNDIDSKSNTWLNSLKGWSTVRQKGEDTDDFTYQLSLNNIKEYFTISDTPPVIAICLSILCYALMLFSYLITKRDTRYPGLKMLFSTKKTAINEL